MNFFLQFIILFNGSFLKAQNFIADSSVEKGIPIDKFGH